jgi:two-component system sensor histidine kinase ChvG
MSGPRAAAGEPADDWRRRLSRIWIRLLAFNVLLLFLPAAGVLYLDTFESQMLDAQEQSMVQQGRILAAALSSSDGSPAADPAAADAPAAATAPTGTAPTETALAEGAGGEGGMIDAAEAERILRALNQRLTSRLRVIDAEGRLIADSSRLGPRAEPGAEVAVVSEAGAATRSSLLYRLGATLFRFWDRLTGQADEGEAPSEFYVSTLPFDGPEIQAALAGRYGATTRVTPGQRSVTLFSALPVFGRDGRPIGAVLVSQSTLRLLAGLYEVRLAVFQVFVGSVVVAVVLSLLLAGTIARPLARLRSEAAALLDRRGRPTPGPVNRPAHRPTGAAAIRGHFGGWRRRDEIGDLARTLEQMSQRLEERIGFIETFAADMSHEFKNPLAAIRNATEVLSEVDDPAERRRFLGMVERDVARLERLLSAVREVSLIDLRLDEEATEEVDLAALLASWLDGARLRLPGGVQLASHLPAEGSAAALRVHADPDRLSQIFENLLSNAFGFAPAGSTVEVRLRRDGDEAVVSVADRGPGFPPEHLDRVFQRFFSYRPQGAGGDHTGLGLSIVKAIAEGYGGSVAARNRDDGGAEVEVRLPAEG